MMAATGCLLVVALATACTHRPPRESPPVSAPLPPVNTSAMDAISSNSPTICSKGGACTRGGELAAPTSPRSLSYRTSPQDGQLYYQPFTLIG